MEIGRDLNLEPWKSLWKLRRDLPLVPHINLIVSLVPEKAQSSLSKVTNTTINAKLKINKIERNYLKVFISILRSTNSLNECYRFKKWENIKGCGPLSYLD